MEEYIVKSMLSGVVVVIMAKSVRNALKKGSEHFSEPNRNKVPVKLLGMR